ncbi:protein late bloomer [Musca vetustissima]|uniref:protein late bloomer n=1 Tax=Musca vetustissima TaxID=27455 RepID=UPI002AB64088|nr:protein late bloomer [Musca vetustissima]
MGCATVTIKYSVFLFNTLCALLGIGTIVVNCLALNNYTDEGRMLCIFWIVLGAIVFLVSFFGCCGAIRENICLTWSYAFFLILLITGNAILHFGYISLIDGETKARKDIDMAWQLQMNGTDAMSHIQNTLACCGKMNSTDYTTANVSIPDSCYSNGNVGNATAIYPDGCLYKLIAVYEAAEHWITIFSWSTLSVEAVAFVSACILAITFRNQERRSRY